MKFPIALILFLMPLAPLYAMEASSDLTSQSLPAHSDFWPPKIHLTGDVETRTGTFSTGQRGVLLRIEGNPAIAVVDFGRDGIHEVPLDQTDALATARRIKDGEEPKPLPNYLSMLGPPKLFRAVEGKMKAIPLHETGDWKGFLFLYLPVEDLDWTAFAGLLEENKDLVRKTGLQPLLLPLSRIKDAELFQKLKEYSLPVAVMHDFLGFSFLNALAHQPGDGPLFVATDLNGKVIGRWDEFTLAPLRKTPLYLNR